MLNTEEEKKIEKFLKNTFPFSNMEALEVIRNKNNKDLFYVYANNLNTVELDTYVFKINFQDGSCDEIDVDEWEEIRDKALSK